MPRFISSGAPNAIPDFKLIKFREALNKSYLSFPRRRKPSKINNLDSVLRWNDDLISVSLVQKYRDVPIPNLELALSLQAAKH